MSKNNTNNGCKNKTFRLFYVNGRTSIYKTGHKKMLEVYRNDPNISFIQEEQKTPNYARSN